MLPGERGIAQGATHAGSRLAGALTPVLVAALIGAYSWHAPFFLFGLIGIVWAAIWYWFYRDIPSEHPSINDAERAKIVAALGQPKGRPPIPWKLILSSRQMWTVAAMYFCYGYALNVFITYYPKYLDAARGYSLKEMGFFASLPLAAGVVGDILGGVFSDAIIHRTGKIKFARQSVAIVGFIIAAVCCPLAVLQPDRYISALLFGFTVFGLELVVGNAWAVTLDIGGSFAGSCSAVMNFVGNLGGAIMATVTVFIVKEWGWNYAFYAVSVMAVLGAALFTQIDAGRKLAPEPASPVV
jgi:sugar phosphate permease